MSETPTLVSVNRSLRTGEIKEPVGTGQLIEDRGLKDDAHAGAEIKQVSLLDMDEIRAMEKRTGVDLSPGEFAENLTSEGLDLASLQVGTKLRIGERVLLEVSQIGKKCHEDCVVKEKTGECIMPEKGIFFRVLRGGPVSSGDPIRIEG